MGFPKKGGWLIGAGFLLGTVGVKLLTSQTARKCYVHGVAKGLQAKAAYEGIVEQAKAEVDDIVAEATYLSVQTASEPASEEKAASEPASEEKAAKKSSK